MRTSWILPLGSLMLLVACDGGVVDAGLDAGARDAALDASRADGDVRADAADVGIDGDVGIEDGDAGNADADVADAGNVDAGVADAGDVDAGVADAGDLDAGGDEDAGRDSGTDAGTDAGSDAGTDAGHDASSDAGTDAGTDAATIDPCTPLPSGLTTFSRSDTASVGTPDSYFLAVTPGDPFCASITGGGSGEWSVNVSNGTSAGLYCSGDSTCSILVPPGQTTLIVTAVTTDIGGYTLTVHYRPR
jgi:hypothetical protein